MRAAPLLLAILTLAACSESATSVVATPDVAETDAGPIDVASTDTSTPDVPSLDTPVADVPSPDVSSLDTPIADTPSPDVPALPDVVDAGCTPSACARGSYCDPMTGRCETGCDADDDCATATADGGAPSRRCDVATRACVECVVDDHCPAGFLCVGNVCAAGCTATRGCPTGQSCCGGACVDPAASTAHCGGCGTVCAAPNATPACMNGTCIVGRCDPGFGDCDGSASNGCETDTQRSATHCGACGTACAARPNTRATCEAARCVYACNAGFADCDGNPDNGCEVELGTTLAHCGACGRRCDPPNAAPRCAMGACEVASCGAGFGDCDGNASNGCEVALGGSTAHCGACGNACPTRPNAFPGCVAGRCLSSCVTGFTDCDGRDDTGCEVDLRADRANCGACGRACSPANGTGACAMGACRVAACNAGFADCDGNPDNGCEVALASNGSHCGACGRACPSGVCRDGACAAFGGAFERSDAGCTECFNGNPYTSSCGCPGGFGVSSALRVVNDCRGQGTQHGAVITTCGAPAPGEWGGAFQVDDAVRCGQGCRAANPYTGGCSCPAGYTQITFRAITDTGGCGGLIGSALAWCVAGAAGPRMAGAYQVDDAVPGGVGCRAANPLTGGCSCPAGYNPSALRVEVDSSRGIIGSQVFTCVR